MFRFINGRGGKGPKGQKGHTSFWSFRSFPSFPSFSSFSSFSVDGWWPHRGERVSGETGVPPVTGRARNRRDACFTGLRLLLAHCVLFALALIPVCAWAQPDASLHELSSTTFKLGGVTFDKAARTATIDAKVNRVEGVLEYLVVTETGKTHESVFSTSVNPLDLHLAMLLLGAKSPGTVTDRPPTNLTSGYLQSAPALDGDEIELSVRWTLDGKTHEAPITEFVLCKEKPAPGGVWLYTGSAIYQKRLLAQTDGSIVALVTDPAALVNNPRPGHDDDSIWTARTGRIPDAGTPVRIVFQLRPSKPSK